jgi:hypothetical protein
MRFGHIFVYATSLIVAAAGLWAVLVVGSHLSAPQDLSGDWTLRPLHPAVENGPEAGSQSAQLRIEQSGQFMWIFAGKKRGNLRMIDAQAQPAAGSPTAAGQAAGAGTETKTRYSLAGGNVTATFELIEIPDVWKLTLVGLEPGVYRATREAFQSATDQSGTASSQSPTSAP